MTEQSPTLNQKQEAPPSLMSLGRRKAGTRRTPDAYRPQVWEATPDGAAKIAPQYRAHVQLYAGTLTNSQATAWTATGAYRHVVILVSNNDTSARTFQLHHVVSGGAAGNSNLLRGLGKSLNAGADRRIYVPGMAKGDFISGLCSSSGKVSIVIYGIPQ